ncbi:hypothetical protein DL546_004154 [Coniochaeta pulveracea]|uniref:Uncharacterized protein n=1 Tax=Coniochaeta pulveracea TaxID=177199 RepID=A0A420YD20_9PEZI|nr:hypothetical protein DL546_004154 [Coniochaeta pulveracea]
MPFPLASPAGVIAVAVAVTAAIAIYESPEVRRVAEDVRRRIAIALHSLGDNLDPNQQQTAREPLFNRPEDAEGFLQSRGEAGIDADEETRRRQREELMYWNAIRESKKEEERRQAMRDSSQGSTFDDFLERDATGDRGTYVINTGTDGRDEQQQGLRRRGVEGVRGLSSAVYANPFADEYGVDDYNDEPASSLHPLTPGRDEEVMSDIYNATEPDRATMSQTLSRQSPEQRPDVIFDASDDADMTESFKSLSVTEDSQRQENLADDNMVASQDHRDEAYASIQAWAQNSSNPSFYSPLPVTPVAPRSEVDESDTEIVSHGMLTPTYSASIAGSGVDVANDVVSQTGDEGRVYNVMSDDESEGMATPTGSWSEVGSVVSSQESSSNHH